jgi:hypothetical protein
MSQLEETMASAEEALARLVADPEPASLTELVEELKRTVKISMPAALLGAAGSFSWPTPSSLLAWKS